MNRIAIIFICILLFSGCATQANYERRLGAWTGHNINELFSRWGYPTSSFKAPNGEDTIYVYTKGTTVTTPSQTSYSGQVSPWGTYSGSGITWGGQQINLSCKTYFVVDKNGVITTSSCEGNACVSH
jgi:hypothetical protein